MFLSKDEAPSTFRVPPSSGDLQDLNLRNEAKSIELAFSRLCGFE